MPGIARVGDTHSGTCNHNKGCCPHNVTGTITTGSGSSSADGSPIAFEGSEVIHNCPHCGTGYISSGSGMSTADGKKIARIGDTVIYPGGSGVITGSSSSSSSN